MRGRVCKFLRVFVQGGEVCWDPRAEGFTVGLLSQPARPGRVAFGGHVSVLVEEG